MTANVVIVRTHPQGYRAESCDNTGCKLDVLLVKDGERDSAQIPSHNVTKPSHTLDFIRNVPSGNHATNQRIGKCLHTTV